MRGTLFDNERVRRDGIWEMKAAKAVRDYKRKRAAEKRARGEKTGGGILSLFGLGRSRRSKKRPVGGRHSSGHGVVLVRGSTSRTHSGRSSHSSRRSGSRRHEKGMFHVAKFEHNTELCDERRDPVQRSEEESKPAPATRVMWRRHTEE